MFIATAITNQSKLRRSETKGALYMRSCGAVKESRRESINISSHGIHPSKKLAQKTSSSTFATQRIPAKERKRRTESAPSALKLP